MSLVNEVVIRRMAGATDRIVSSNMTSRTVATLDGSSVFSNPT
ncbi:hypothetical protein DBT_0557 [Dissulfuribacter thermophilus]|uniref:Uncharacterized protein n=1 Tax=Dissulfuribacter thermophilus TaxID=1156395 RepID=A0A1B9F8F7_9BACT|nr:hypothetical protein DBT_0557 [Dissulfuribacter thermophilus]